MKNKELQELLKNFPDDMEVWVSDNGYCERGQRLNTVEIVKAVDAGLDGDEVGDEYIYVEGDTNISEYLAKGYFLSEDGETLSKEIIYLNNLNGWSGDKTELEGNLKNYDNEEDN